MPIEIKYRGDIKALNLNGLEKFKQLYKTSKSIVITKDLLDKNNDTIFIPFWLIK